MSSEIYAVSMEKLETPPGENYQIHCIHGGTYVQFTQKDTENKTANHDALLQELEAFSKKLIEEHHLTGIEIKVRLNKHQ